MRVHGSAVKSVVSLNSRATTNWFHFGKSTAILRWPHGIWAGTRSRKLSKGSKGTAINRTRTSHCWRRRWRESNEVTQDDLGTDGSNPFRRLESEDAG